jgi:hypothetical protein
VVRFSTRARVKKELFVLIVSKSVFPVILGVREVRFSARGVFYFVTETRGNCILRLVFNDVNRRTRQFALNKMDVSSHLQL